MTTFDSTGRLEEDAEGRLVLNQVEYNLPLKAPYLILTRKDKTSLYPLRNTAYSIDKVKIGADVNIIVLGEDQKLYFRQVILNCFKLLGIEPVEAKIDYCKLMFNNSLPCFI